MNKFDKFFRYSQFILYLVSSFITLGLSLFIRDFSVLSYLAIGFIFGLNFGFLLFKLGGNKNGSTESK